MTVEIINPINKKVLHRNGETLVDEEGNSFPVINQVPRISKLDNYTESFGFQWNIFDKTQLDGLESKGLDLSRERFFLETNWDPEMLSGENILEVGSGAGRFSRVVLEHTKGTLYSVDYSDAVTANFKNNSSIAPNRLNLYQASIYELPFPDNSFDKVFCLGVLQHTPDFDMSVKTLIGKAITNGEIVIDFYPINGWWTKIHAKYAFRLFTKRMKHERLLKQINGNIDWMINFYFFLHKLKLGILTRFLPICDIKNTFPKKLSNERLREWAILDTYDMLSPEYDSPQRIDDVVKMFQKHGARVTFSGFVNYGNGLKAAVVRGIKV